MSRDHDIEVSRDFVGGVLSSLVTTLLSLGFIGLMELEIMSFVISIPIPIPIPMPRFTDGYFNWRNKLAKQLCSSSVKEINRLIWKGMSNIYHWKKLTFSKLRFSWKENLKKCTSFEEQKGIRYIPRNPYIGIIVFSKLLSTKTCLRFF